MHKGPILVAHESHKAPAHHQDLPQFVFFILVIPDLIPHQILQPEWHDWELVRFTIFLVLFSQDGCMSPQNEFVYKFQNKDNLEYAAYTGYEEVPYKSLFIIPSEIFVILS